MRGIISAEDNINEVIGDMINLYEKIGEKSTRLYIRLDGDFMEAAGEPSMIYYSDTKITDKEMAEIAEEYYSI